MTDKPIMTNSACNWDIIVFISLPTSWQKFGHLYPEIEINRLGILSRNFKGNSFIKSQFIATWSQKNYIVTYLSLTRRMLVWVGELRAPWMGRPCFTYFRKPLTFMSSSPDLTKDWLCVNIDWSCHNSWMSWQVLKINLQYLEYKATSKFRLWSLW